MKKEEKGKLNFAPIISGNSLRTLNMASAETLSYIISTLCLAFKLFMDEGIENFQKYYKKHVLARPEGVSDMDWDILGVVFNELEESIHEAIRNEKRTFVSEDDVVENIIKTKRIPAELVLAMCGGKWPRHEFNFDTVSHFHIERKKLVPKDGAGDELPGPDLGLKIVYDPLKA